MKRYKPLRSEFTGRSDRLLVVTVPTLLAEGNLPALQRVVLSLLINLPAALQSSSRLTSSPRGRSITSPYANG